jgi:hypothetical protein
MNDELETFMRTYLHEDTAYDTTGFLRPTLLAFKESFVRGVREGLDKVLQEKTLSTGTYERLTAVEFTEDEALYNYLQSIYDHLFGERPVQPSPSRGN